MDEDRLNRSLLIALFVILISGLALASCGHLPDPDPRRCAPAQHGLADAERVLSSLEQESGAACELVPSDDRWRCEDGLAAARASVATARAVVALACRSTT